MYLHAFFPPEREWHVVCLPLRFEETLSGCLAHLHGATALSIFLGLSGSSCFTRILEAVRPVELSARVELASASEYPSTGTLELHRTG